MPCDLQAAVAEWLVTGGSGGMTCDLQAAVAEWLMTYRP
jgi:hypothetical protein